MSIIPANHASYELAVAMVALVRRHERNCRCPHCMSHQMPCVECEACRENLRETLLAAMVASPIFVLRCDEDRATIGAMNKKNLKTSPKAKARKSTSKPTPKLKGKKTAHVPKMHAKRAVPQAARHQKKTPTLGKTALGKRLARTAALHKTMAKAAARKTPAPAAAKRRPAAPGQYDHCIFTRLGSNDRKELIRKAADATGASMAEYVAHFAAEAARAGTSMPAEKGPVEVGKKPKTTEFGSRVLAAFDSKAVKLLVMKAAHAAKVSASSYIAHFAVEAAKAGAKLPVSAKTTAEAGKTAEVGQLAS